MVNPRTVNTGIIVPLTGADVDEWGANDVNPNMVAIDGYLAGLQQIAISAAPITLTSPALFTATPTPGPTQAQNRILQFTGALTGNVAVTLPLPGVYVIENLTTGNFVTQIGALTVTEVVCIEQGARRTVYNDGANVRFVDLPSIGNIEQWGGLNAMPAWVQNCTKKPYLLCDGTVYNFSDFPYLAARLGGAFGGNGITTFGVPDLRGRMAIPYDSTGARITAGVSGINGQTIGAAGGDQNPQQHSHTFGGTTSGMDRNTSHTHTSNGNSGTSTSGGGSFTVGGSSGETINATNIDHAHPFSGTTAASGSGGSGNVQPSIVTGISVIRAG